MRLFDVFARRGLTRGFHSTVVTTFGVEFAAFEQVLLPQFNGAGSGNVVLLADPGMVALALADGMSMPLAAGSGYVVKGVSGHGGVFHPKIVFQVGRGGARIVVGSANATSAGIAGNREVVTEVTCGNEPSPERAFAVAVWEYLADLVGDAPGPAHDALTWLEGRTPWLVGARDDPAVRVWTLADETRLGFFANGSTQTSMLDRFVDEIGDTPIERLVVMSPYWDPGLVALRALIQALRPAETKVLIQAGRKLFPTGAATGLPIELLEAMPGKATSGDPAIPSGRFSHAKVIIATGGGYDHILSGSANCTLAALGARGRPGHNGEASVYRRLPTGTAENVLKLADALASKPLDLATLPPMEEEPPIPLEAAVASSPGIFEADFAQLTWRPPQGLDLTQASVELLLDPQDDLIAQIDADAWRAHGETLRATVEAAGEAAKFVRVRLNGWTSGLAIISRHDVLRNGRRERSSRSVERASNEMTRAGLDLHLLELLNLLEKDDQDTEAEITKTRRMGRAEAAADAPHQHLEYEEFIKVRRATKGGPVSGGERNSLAGTSADVLRTLLNDLIDGGASATIEEDLAEEELPDGDLNGGGSSSGGGMGLGGGIPPKVKPLRPSAFDPRVYEKAVAAYWTKVRGQAQAGQIGSNQVLRLRTWLMLLLSERKRLACDDGETGWPRLMVRVLAAFFSGPTPPIKRLVVDPRYDQVPNDFIEAWVAVIAALDALRDCCDTLGVLPNGSGLPGHIKKLDVEVRVLIGLAPDDLASVRFGDAAKSLTAYLEAAQAAKATGLIAGSIALSQTRLKPKL